jgi:hypothetical protein
MTKGIVTKVLYVEHNDDNLCMLKTRLELLGGFEVLAADDSEKGCELAETARPDVILESRGRRPSCCAHTERGSVTRYFWRAFCRTCGFTTLIGAPAA